LLSTFMILEQYSIPTVGAVWCGSTPHLADMYLCQMSGSCWFCLFLSCPPRSLSKQGLAFEVLLVFVGLPIHVFKFIWTLFN
jgi:hypothetical protein